MNPPSDTVTDGPLWWRLPISTVGGQLGDFEVSSSVSVGNPVRKYSCPPPAPRVADLDRAVEVPLRMSLLMTRRIPLRARLGREGRPATPRCSADAMSTPRRRPSRTAATPTPTARLVVDDAADHVADAGEVGGRQRDVRATSSAGATQSTATIERTCSAGRSRTGRVTMPA